MILRFLTKYRDFGLLLLRLGLGVFFVMHGAPKIMGGPKVWAVLGKATANVGIDVFPAFWGFMAAFSECFGGIFLVLGLFFRPAVILLAFTMTVASVMHVKKGDNFLNVASRPMELAVVFYSLIFIGPGRFSIDKE
jgi:putative oxidoreductase